MNGSLGIAVMVVLVLITLAALVFAIRQRPDPSARVKTGADAHSAGDWSQAPGWVRLLIIVLLLAAVVIEFYGLWVSLDAYATGGPSLGTRLTILGVVLVFAMFAHFFYLFAAQRIAGGARSTVPYGLEASLAPNFVFVTVISIVLGALLALLLLWRLNDGDIVFAVPDADMAPVEAAAEEETPAAGLSAEVRGGPSTEELGARIETLEAEVATLRGALEGAAMPEASGEPTFSPADLFSKPTPDGATPKAGPRRTPTPTSSVTPTAEPATATPTPTTTAVTGSMRPPRATATLRILLPQPTPGG